jgi:type II secretion system protein G
MVPSIHAWSSSYHHLRMRTPLHCVRTDDRLIPRDAAHSFNKRDGIYFAMHDCKPLHQSETFSQKRLKRGFTLLELLLVISIIGLLATILLPALQASKNKAYQSRARSELNSIRTALELYQSDHGGSYPSDVSRGLPAGVEIYLNPGQWPAAPWPGSEYDWDNWTPSDLDYPPFTQTYQISIRFCPNGQPTQCKFPNEPWAANFDYYSSAYYCISGSCRAHADQPTTHPAYCVNC